MAKNSSHRTPINSQPRLHQRAKVIQAYGTVTHALPLELEEPVRLEMTERLNQLLADTITLRDLYKKCHWQVVGPTFYQLHLLFDKHYDQQNDLVDAIGNRVRPWLLILATHRIAAERFLDILQPRFERARLVL